MGKTRVQIVIKAPAADVFDIWANPARIPDVHPDRTVTFKTDQTEGIGTQFVAYRTMRGKPYATTLVITEMEAPVRVRTLADQGGALWDTISTFTTTSEGTKVDVVMEERPYKLGPRITIPLIRPFLRKAMMEDLEAARDFLERRAVN